MDYLWTHIIQIKQVNQSKLDLYYASFKISALSKWHWQSTIHIFITSDTIMQLQIFVCHPQRGKEL
jgi:hypothetical protein